MRKITFSVLALWIMVGLFSVEISAQGFRGGGGAARSGGGAARSGGGGGASRPATRPSAPSMGASRPSPSRPSPSGPSPSGPSPSRPNVSGPSVNRPTTRPATPSRPEVNRPSGGLKPSTRPSTPSTRPSQPGTRPSLPTTLPGNKLPGQGSNPGNTLPNRPENRPSIPGLGGGAGNRPNGNFPNRPDGGRPNVNLPNRPDGGRPNANLPGAGSRPNLPGNGGRPSAGDVGDFLGMDKLRPAPLPGTTRPGIGNGIWNRPGIDNGIGNRPGIDNGIGNRPGVGNGIGNRPNIGNGNGNNIGNNVINNGSVNIGQINVGNNVAISNRPTWANLDRGRVTSINNRWQNQIGGMHNWRGVHPNRAAFWAGWGVGVHSSFRWHHRNPGCFRGNWWYGHPCRWGGWNYGYGFANRPWRFWWTVPTYAACVNWFAWQAPPTVWVEPVYYDYGQGGNVVYNDNSVYINGDEVATSTEFAQSAADLATVPAPASEEEAQKAEWLALGTFTVSAGENDVDPTRIVQLAVSKEGIVSGTLYNTETDETQTIQGQVDKETQRVAVRFGESEDIVVETGLYNLTQAEAPVLVHFGPEKVESWLLVRLDDPAPDDESGASSVPQQ